MRLLILICLCALSLPSCTLPPSKVTSANVPLPSRFDSTQPPVPEIATSLKSLFPSSDVALWINRALTRNPDLKASLARLQEAGFNTRRTRAALSPTLFENAAAGRSDFGSSASNFSATLDAQWELDVWGQIRAGVTAASRDEAALAADYAAARQSIAAQTAQAYFGLVAASQLVELNERSLKSFESTFSRVERRFERGLSSLGDSELARTDVENTRAQLAARQNQRDQAARRLATLTGDYPKTDRHAPKFPSLSKSIPSGVPSTLLMKRPDVDAAYQRIRAADARVTVAHRDLYPSFSLTASAGQRSSTLKNLADSNFSVWSFAANMSAPLFDGGLRQAELGAAGARAEQALSNYHSTVLNALREVEDALGSERYLAKQEAATQRALTAARRAEDSVRRNYESGLLELLSLLETQRRSFNTEEALINVRALRYQNRVALALALGKAY
ncbi:efflux transporter outer membrane subunit [Akkermansiaceae bacterium]|nr:efflux transporter outer membrane subunit [Akkermansiaceae bacterium]MDC1405701.1 efflux transporter outer membrane subunit [Akkermansiaceae bacterium]